METQQPSNSIHTPPPSDALAEGTSLQGGAYQVGPVLGQGGFGITYLGHDTRLRRRAAIKEFFPSGSTHKSRVGQVTHTTGTLAFETAKAEFLNEAQLLARFDHPGIVHIYTVLEENDTIYIIMEYLQGKTLLHLLEEHGSIPHDEALHYIEKVSNALKIVHQANLLHRDIKPGNIMVCDDGRVVLLDFGLTKEIELQADYGTRRLSGTANVGTEGYAPIEQYGHHAQLHPTTDIYALAATLYHLLTGNSPIPATARAAGDVLAAPHTLCSSLPVALSAAIMQGLDMDALKRPQTVQDFLSRLEAHHLTVSAPTDLQQKSCAECGALNAASNVVCIKCGSWLVAPTEQLGQTDNGDTPTQNSTIPPQPLPAWINQQDGAVTKDQNPQLQEWWRTGDG